MLHLFLLVTLWAFRVFYAATVDRPEQCIANSSTMDSLMKCLDKFILRKDTLSDNMWETVTPTANERAAWTKVIQNMLDSNGNCDQPQILPTHLRPFIKISKFVDGTNAYCVLYETQVFDEHFAKGWGIFAVPFNSGSASNMVHISAAHPLFDGPVHHQAFNLFHKTFSRSVLISGQDRFASTVKSACESFSTRTDGAHDNTTMFHTANLAIMEWQLSKHGCPRDRCTFLQLHGKKSSACPESVIFLSTGPHNPTFYQNNQLPVNRLKTHLRHAFGTDLTVNTPLEDNSCKLTAGSNIFLRVLNGVKVGEECRNGALDKDVKGYFIHAEQSAPAGQRISYKQWAEAVSNTFG